jgi:N-alpha-acetyl-L-2,4-diaminobutyrate deacetylase
MRGSVFDAAASVCEGLNPVMTALHTPNIAPSPITPTVDYEADGIQHGFLQLPHSHDDSAWGAMMIPVVVIKNGDGPTALLTAGNHGDEYEGQIALRRLAHEVDLSAVNGRIIALPALNYPAARVGRRTSPIDGGNMNRAFPGRPDGTMTERIADYVTRHLLPKAQIVLDIHSGGRTLELLPFAACHELEDSGLQARCIAARDAFGAPYSVLMRELDSLGMFDTTVEESGTTFVTTEIFGGGTSRPEGIAVTVRGVRNVLIHAEILNDIIEPSPSIALTMPDGCFVMAQAEGLLEPLVGLGEPVNGGQPVARVHDFTRTSAPPVELTAPFDGILAGRHFSGRVAMGDNVCMVATVDNGTLGR